MKATVLQKDFTKILTVASRFVSSRAQLPILSNIKISSKGTKIIVEATNLEMSISASLGAKVDSDGEVAVPSRVITDLVGNIRGEKIILSSEGEMLSLSTEGFSADITGLNTADFPQIPGEVSKGVSFSVEDFSGALDKTLFSSSPDDTRPALAGILLAFSEKGMSLVSSDGFRLSQKNLAVKDVKEGRVIIPKGILSEISRLSSGEKNMEIFVDEDNKQVLFEVGDMVLSSRLVEGEYPPFEKIIPESSSIIVNVSKADFQNAIKTASVFARDGANIVKLSIKENSLMISAESSVSGKQEALIDAKVKGPEIDIVYNYRYLEEFLAVVRGESVTAKFNSPESAGVFLDTDDEDYLHLVMPVKS